MKGLDLSKAYFETYGRPMLAEQFPELLPYLAAGLIGSGSECFGFDDDISTDHDFEPGFILFLPGEDVIDRRQAFLLERAYAKLPKEFLGFHRQMLSPVGGPRHGVIRISEFMKDKLGTEDGTLTLSQWLTLPSETLAEVTNGEIFFDNLGELSQVRAALSRYPEDIRLKKLASHLLLMAQSGQYNYLRCLKHGEVAAAQLAVVEFVKHTISTIFLLNNAYEPYYKWSFRALRQLPKLSIQAELLEYLLTTDNEPETAEEKYNVIEGIASDIIDELQNQDLTKAICGDLEKHAYSVNDAIADADVRNLHVLAGV
ncbi:MAG: DUF4037 domain-containing protein [Lachnospiraceae bacterium]|nr:DUF4037 domain-containing protein [Lachnospiraceae bacterium]